MSDSTIRFHDYSALTFGKPQLFDELKTKLNKKNYKEGILCLIDEVDLDDTKKDSHSIIYLPIIVSQPTSPSKYPLNIFYFSSLFRNARVKKNQIGLTARVASLTYDYILYTLIFYNIKLIIRM